jgi:hypothetical protein
LTNTNIFVYCLNNPKNRLDIDGLDSSRNPDINGNRIPDYYEEKMIEKENYNRVAGTEIKYRDVTEEINNALEKAKNHSQRNFLIKSLYAYKFIEFYNLVKDKAEWDIKNPDSWKTTIGTDYPGEISTVVTYEGHYYTPEILGNYTYGVIGKAYGIDIDTLLFGSMLAAGFPSIGTSDFNNEMRDWVFIAKGYYNN